MRGMTTSREEDAEHAAIARDSPTRRVFVGHLEDMVELRRAVDERSAGRGALVLLTGEPGIGKTRLCEELAHLTADSGFGCCGGRCHEADAPTTDPARRGAGRPTAGRSAGGRSGT